MLLFQARGPIARAIRWAGRSSYSHAALVIRIEVVDPVEQRQVERVFCAESREGRGCRLVALSSVLTAARVDLYRPNGQADETMRQAVRAHALERLGQPYGWGQVAAAALARMPLVSLLVPRQAYSEDDERDPGRRLDCSAYVAVCWRLAGLDLVPRLADGSTVPGDLARSSSLSFAGTLKLCPPAAEE